MKFTQQLDYSTYTYNNWTNWKKQIKNSIFISSFGSIGMNLGYS